MLPWNRARRHGKERTCLLKGVAQPVETAAQRNEVQKVAMLPGGGVSLMCS